MSDRSFQITGLLIQKLLESYNKCIEKVRISGLLWGETTDERWFPLTKGRYWNLLYVIASSWNFRLVFIPQPNEVGGGYTGFTLSVCPSVRPSVCRRHGFRSISQVCFGISISNFICMLMVAIGRSLLIFSDVTFKMAAWRPYWIFWFPDSNFTLALHINFNLQRHNTYVYV